MVFIIIVLWVWYLASVGLALTDVQDNKEERLVKAESIDQLIELIKSALQEKNPKRLEQIKSMNVKLVRENISLIIIKCNKSLREAIKNELSTQIKISNQFFSISQILAEIYKKAVKSTYLLDRVKIFRKWGKEEKEKYCKEVELFNKGKELYYKYKYYEAIELFDKSLDICRTIGHIEGEATCLGYLGAIYLIIDEKEKALQKYEQSLSLYRKVYSIGGEANCLQGLGDVYSLLDQKEKAHEKYKQALNIYRQINDNLGKANCLQGLGDLYIKSGEYDNARQQFEQAFAIFKEIKIPFAVANLQIKIGDVYTKMNDYEKAIQNYEQALSTCMHIKYYLGEANCLKNMGDLYTELSIFEKAKKHYERTLEICRKIKYRLGEANCLLSFGNLNLGFNNYENARDLLVQALGIFTEINDRIGQANCLYGLGEVQRALADYDKSFQYYEKSLIICTQIQYHLGEANCLQSLGDIYRLLGDYDKALNEFKRAVEIYREIKYRLGEANCLRCIGDVYIELSIYENARNYYDQSLKICREIKYRLGEANCLINIGDVYMGLSLYTKAKNYYERSMALYKEIKCRLGEANCRESLGKAHMALFEFKKARKQHDQALSIQKKIGNRQGMLWSYYNLGKTYDALKNYTAAKENYSSSIECIEDVLQGIKVEDFKLRYFASKMAPYEDLIKLLFKIGIGEDAFSFAERSKARSFLYLLGNKRIDPRIGTTPDLARKEIELRQKINSIIMRIMENEKKEEAKRVPTKKMKEQLLQLKLKHSEILEKIKLKSPEYASMLTVNPLSVEKIQKLIQKDNGTVLIEYYITPTALCMWLLDGKNLYPYKIDISEKKINNGIQQFRSLLADASSVTGELRPRARKLYKILLKPIEKHIQGKDRIAVVPHGILHYLPFEALMNKGKFLIEQDIKFFYLPSASVYKYCRDINSMKKDQLMAIANPDGTLPYSEKEVKEIKNLYTQNAKIFMGKDAKESTIRKNVSYPDILHFACHGKFDSEHPMYSALVLAPGSDDDGRLEVTEIFNLKLKPAYIVTMSACETKLGGILRGDEIVGLSRAFIYAGTPSIVASLWKVDDESSARFMADFYRALKTNDKIEALDIARKTMIRKYGKRHPFYWGAFVLIGDPR
jgi:CHAT domain-containing protein/uncharacterized protein HemY